MRTSTTSMTGGGATWGNGCSSTSVGGMLSSRARLYCRATILLVRMSSFCVLGTRSTIHCGITHVCGWMGTLPLRREGRSQLEAKRRSRRRKSRKGDERGIRLTSEMILSSWIYSVASHRRQRSIRCGLLSWIVGARSVDNVLRVQSRRRPLLLRQRQLPQQIKP